MVPPLRYDSREIDELVVRFRVKRRYRYLWIAVWRLTRQVLAFFLRNRSLQSLRILGARVPPTYRREAPLHGRVRGLCPAPAPLAAPAQPQGQRAHPCG